MIEIARGVCENCTRFQYANKFKKSDVRGNAATPDGSLPIEYQRVLDPLDVLAYVAANTTKISLGTSVADMFFYTPIMLVKRYATLDVLSEGRIIAGLGLGC